MRAHPFIATMVASLAVTWPLHSAAGGQESLPDGSRPDLEVFVRDGCPHCARAKEFLAVLARRRPDLEIVIHEVVKDRAALERLQSLADDRRIAPVGVPAFFLRDQLLIGFQDAETTGRQLEAMLGTGDVKGVLDLPIVGVVDVGRVGLPLFTVLVGLVDGVNPCAMWALIYLLSLLVNFQDRRRMLLVAGTFVAVGGIVYFGFIAAWFELFMLIGLSRVVQVALGGVACVAGGVNVRDFFAVGQGFTLSIPDSAKPSVYARIRRVITADNLLGAIGAVAVLAVLINLVELLCTAGLPALYTQILSAQDLPRVGHYGYLSLYILAYIFDDSLVLAVAVVTLSRHRLQERGGRWLKLLSGAVMVVLGAILIVRPGWLL